MTRLLLAAVLLFPAAAFAESYETVPPGEADAAAAVVAMIEATVDKDKAETGSAHRDAHAKAHGCVRATFRVEDALPGELRKGIFQEGKTYRAWIRYSNGGGRAAPDAKGDGRGMAVKLAGVPGPKLADEKETQDFLMINSPAFFVRDAADYVDFMKAASAGKPFSFFMPGANPLRWRLHELKAALAITRRKTDDPLAIRYWSMAPYLLGDSGPVKYSARPCAPVAAAAPDRANPDYLRAAMGARLKDAGACYEFLVQLRTDPARQPVEDPTVEWSEKTAPFRKVATIEIPPQRFDGSAQRAFCENLSMNPWHAAPEHRPLGGINRVRRTVYEAISRRRHEHNAAARAEPSGGETFPD